MSTEITHEKTPDTHSSIVGGSSASRILGCPGSVDLLAKIDAQIDAAAFGLEMEAQSAQENGKIVEAEELFASAERMRASKNASSSYADEGTGLHEIMAYLVDNDVDINTVVADEKVDQLFDQYKLHDDRMWDAVLPAYRSFLAYLDTLYESDDDEVRIRVESRVEMPGIDGAFGTCDVLIRAPKKTVVWDWKFGQGVPVLASYKTTTYVQVNALMGSDGTPNEPELEPEEDEVGNDQLMFYARAAMESYPDYFEATEMGDWPVELIICQPRILDEELSRFETNTLDLENFRLDLVDAVDEALSGKGRKAKGSYCRFAKCKAICPLHLNGPVAIAEIGEKLGKLQMLASQTPATSFLSNDGGAETQRIEADKVEYAEALAMMLDLAEIVEPYIKEATAQAHAFMEAGGEIPHYKLVPKKAGWDSWLDEKKTDAFLGRQGLSVEERRKPWQSITPAVARKHLKAKGDEKGLKLLEKYVQPGVSSGTTIAPSDDPREAVQATATMVKSLADKIASLGT